ncbi:hypothetical protein [Jejuia pallidilutea]|uniref:Uncharacterized protein n=2 Tax=Jejuia pallidilutea TaxID=504487 RepID=A0A090WP09_9FLAO|nr:hypothetical protein [Jejuia pallidilutea]GAL69172.1 hypothetical protein JCM19301_2781 [Jejuia pallidilutea]
MKNIIRTFFLMFLIGVLFVNSKALNTLEDNSSLSLSNLELIQVASAEGDGWGFGSVKAKIVLHFDAGTVTVVEIENGKKVYKQCTYEAYTICHDSGKIDCTPVGQVLDCPEDAA